MSKRVNVMSEISEGLRCADCEQRYKPGESRIPVGDMGETAHPIGECALEEATDGD